MSLFRIFDYRQWESLNLEGFIEDGKLSDRGVFYSCLLMAGISYGLFA